MAEVASPHGRQWPSLELRAGVLPFRVEQGEIEFLLIRRHGHTDWAIPKGHLLAFRDPAVSAQLEAYQEAGVQGAVSREAIGSYIHIKASQIYGRQADAIEVIVFPMEVARVEPRWPEMHVRERRWVEAANAPQLVVSERLRDMMRRFEPLLASA